MPIVANGGGPLSDEEAGRLSDYVLGLAGRERPRICYVPTAMGDAAESVVRFYETYAGRGELSHAGFFPWPRPDLREHVLAQDVLVVSGGNTANMLAIWRVHGFDAILREAWERGVVLAGGSAGMICWFEASVTDSFGPQLAPLREGLGFLAGSACPHYDEELRRTTYRELVGDGFPAGVAVDVGAALRYEGAELVEVVAFRPGARAYRVEAGSETPLEARAL